WERHQPEVALEEGREGGWPAGKLTRPAPSRRERRVPPSGDRKPTAGRRTPPPGTPALALPGSAAGGPRRTPPSRSSARSRLGLCLDKGGLGFFGLLLPHCAFRACRRSSWHSLCLEFTFQPLGDPHLRLGSR